MKKQLIRRWLSFTFCTLLIAAIAVFTVGCSDNKQEKETPKTPDVSDAQTNDAGQQGTLAGTAEKQVVGQGETVFDFTVVDKDGNETVFEVHTDKKTVGEALTDAKLIEGDQGDFGLYVKKVNGITADYDVDGTYWAFYENGEYAMTGVDKTDIKDGYSYSFKVEK